ncbi:MAG: toll/interleukin-1 receptor domain-containing protein [Methylobacter sp.]|uniref:toll/interleukin-1 receptor domain-containing protein n=1 Tax=Methylobacter sp. TaxID=2051955 RepID=UPI0025EB583F|nr:toll/interleukin-1 receptor domain-containing protein [Methylobacter sp.]MCK9619135.1 toll/interleukin-1 receptor domain-containing protein [Methylobacter sp.]
MSITKLRELVFISHATPDDNEFTLWLSTRLKLAGYQVWSDVTQLFGGEMFWDDIQEAISDYTCKFIIVITRTSLSKPGVQREVEYALEAEKFHSLPNFIIPIIIDDSSFSNQPYGFSDRNIIPFRNGWADGFSRLIERFKRDDVPQHPNDKIDIGAFIRSQTGSQTSLVEKADKAVTNWLEIMSYPEQLNFYRLPLKPDQYKKRFVRFPYPWFEYATFFSSFCNLSDMKEELYQWESPSAVPTLNINSTLKGEPTNYPFFESYEVVKKLNFMIADAWSKEMRKRGLHCYSMASGKEAFFFPDDEKYSGQRRFPDINGEERRRSLIGYSGKNQVFWHFAIEAKTSFGVQPKLTLMPHVVFTEDGRNPLSDNKRMHRLRRGFCKSWWNDRWRDMLLVYLHLISEGNEFLELSVGSNQKVVLASRPSMLDSPVSIVLGSDLEQIVDDDMDNYVSEDFKEDELDDEFA